MSLVLDGEIIRADGALLELSPVDSEIFRACLTCGEDAIILEWNVPGKNPKSWIGNRFRGGSFAFGDHDIKAGGDKVGILIEITDVKGRFVSGRFSGKVGVGDGTHSISNGTFRAPVVLNR